MATSPAPTEPQLGDPLPGTMEKIKQSCNRFRVLVLGKEGVGKSSLINHIFKVEEAEVSEYTSGAANINKEIFSAANDSFVLHDSRGYRAGEIDNFQKLTEFINNRTDITRTVGDRLHAIWLCVATPTAGGRLQETGDEKIFQVVRGKVPIIVVFTQYDELVMKEEYKLQESGIQRTDDEIKALAKSKAYQFFDERCITPMKKANNHAPCLFVSVRPHFEETLQNLVKTTLHHINPGEYPLPQIAPTNQPEPSKRPFKFRNFSPFKSSKKAEICEPTKPINVGDANPVSVMFATAQRVDLDAKITASVSVGREKYWRGLGSGANFLGKTLRRCLEVVHDDIVGIWNFPSLDMLFDEDFRGRVTKLVEAGFVDPQRPSANSNILQNTANVAGAAGAIVAVAAGAANPVGFIVGPIIAAAVFAKWAYDVYRATPGVLKCFMAYIVDLIIIMQMIFIISERRENGVVKPEEVEGVLKEFENNQRRRVHREIRQFVDQLGVAKAVTDKDQVLEKIEELIEKHRVKGEFNGRGTEMPG